MNKKTYHDQGVNKKAYHDQGDMTRLYNVPDIHAACRLPGVPTDVHVLQQADRQT